MCNCRNTSASRLRRWRSRKQPGSSKRTALNQSMPDPSSMWLPLGFHEWMPLAQALTLGLLTFVQEDVPTVSAALLAAAGSLTWKVGFLGCFLGIWIGDALLYGLARGVGRPMMHLAWARRFVDPVAVARSEQWFADKGAWLLLSSRFVPGARLPTYLYDARNSLFFAYRTLFRQWELVFAIGAANRRSGSLPTKLPLLWRKW